MPSIWSAYNQGGGLVAQTYVRAVQPVCGTCFSADPHLWALQHHFLQAARPILHDVRPHWLARVSLKLWIRLPTEHL